MPSVLSLEPLEDRYLLSGVAVSGLLPLRPDVLQQEIVDRWALLNGAGTSVEGAITNADLRSDIQRLLLSYPSLANRDGDSRREDRYLLSGVAVSGLLPLRPDVLQQEIVDRWALLNGAGTSVEGAITNADFRSDIQRLLLSYPSLANRDGDSRREDFIEFHRDILFSSIVAAMNSPGLPSADSAARSDRPPSHSGGETWDRLSPATDRIPGSPEVGGQRTFSPSSPDVDSPVGLDTAVFAEWTAEPGLRGAFADSIILDAWSDAVPAPQADLVPASDRDLATIAVYVVRAVARVQTQESRPLAGTETGLTDLIVGRIDLRSGDAVLERPVASAQVGDLAVQDRQRQDYPVAEPDHEQTARPFSRRRSMEQSPNFEPTDHRSWYLVSSPAFRRNRPPGFQFSTMRAPFSSGP
jgi:hypothetical protein